MRIAITIESDNPIMQDIWDYCHRYGIDIYLGRYIIVNDHYYIWRIDAKPSKYLDYLLIRWNQHLVVY